VTYRSVTSANQGISFRTSFGDRILIRRHDFAPGRTDPKNEPYLLPRDPSRIVRSHIFDDLGDPTWRESKFMERVTEIDVVDGVILQQPQASLSRSGTDLSAFWIEEKPYRFRYVRLGAREGGGKRRTPIG
jgi:hypothetical protein